MVTKGRRGYWLRQELLSPIIKFLQPALFAAAFVWRRLLFRTIFIGVTGSLGKTTAKECLASILASHGLTFRSYRNQNAAPAVVLNILRVRPWHRFAVLEVATGKPGDMKKSAHLLRPDLVILLNVLRTHTTSFGRLEEHALEKQLLLQAAKPRGIAVLNGDDPLVRPMAAFSPCKTLFFGTTPNCDYQATQVSAKWPERLSFQVHSNSNAQSVRTQLVGAHWLGAALAALASADALGVSLFRGAAALRNVEPFPGRLQPLRINDRFVVLRDDYNASIDTVEASLRVMEEARAPRRVLAITDLSDFGTHGRYRRRYLAERARRAAEVLVLIGKMAEYGRRRAIDAGMPEENVHAFPSIRAAAGFLKRELKKDDLLLIKGRTTDHTARIFFAHLGAVGCWDDYCPKRMLCDTCWRLEVTPEQMATAPVVRPPE